MRHLLVSIICVTTLVACGLKGPLYFPEDKPEKPGAEADQQPDRDEVNGQGTQVPGSPLINQ
jgi:predicted small lipoprotein YifL